MDYEKAYKEALEKAKDMLSYKEVKREDMEYLFPELAESEDEKTRKEIIAFIKKRDRSGCDYDYDKWLDWLEKQGEQDNWAEEMNTKIKELHKQCIEIIQKYVSPCEGCNNIKGCVTCVDGSEKAFYEGATSRKQEWSEEDPFRTETLISVIKSGGNIRHELRDEFVNWLKSLKDRVQPKKEWSEEDENCINYILINCMHYAEECGHVEELHNDELHKQAKELLKSLRPQTTWKPSDEQMDALLVKIPIEKSCNKVDNILKSLYSDLKRLK